MSTKNIVIAIVTVIIIALIGYLTYTYTMKPDETTGNEETPAGDNATTTPQVQGEEVKIGTGKTAEPGSTVTVEYIGRLPDGTVFDSSSAQGKPLTFVLGAPGIIPGFQVGVNGMKEGGERIIAIPPELGYGSQQVGTIPPNSTIIFELKLLKVVAATSTTSAQ